VRGLVENKKSWTLEELYQLPQVKQSRATSASKAGARSEAGPGRRCAIF
jgi:DMSO/TMAO reductase YedYZ molybdopterin-dependent catalytic subunit